MALLQARQARTPLAILFTGLTVALVIFIWAGPPSDRSGDRPEDSKKYLRQMEEYGGTANVLASEAREWFEGLWHGRRLAMTIACLALLAAGVSFIALTPLPGSSVKDHPGPDRRGVYGRRPD